MNSAIPVQCFTNWTNKPSRSWSLCCFVIYTNKAIYITCSLVGLWCILFWTHRKQWWCVTFQKLMNSAIPVQCSTNWANKPSGSWSLCCFVIYTNTAIYITCSLVGLCMYLILNTLEVLMMCYLSKSSSWTKLRFVSSTQVAFFNCSNSLQPLPPCKYAQ